MSYINRTLIAAALATGFTGFVASTAISAPSQVCYFGNCAISTAAPLPTPEPAATSVPGQGGETRTLAEHGTWIAVTNGKIVMVMDRFSDGARFGIVYKQDETSILVSSTSWKMHEGDSYDLKMDIDGSVYRGKAIAIDATTLVLDRAGNEFTKEFYKGRKVEVSVADDTFTMTTISDAAATLEAANLYRRTSAPN